MQSAGGSGAGGEAFSAIKDVLQAKEEDRVLQEQLKMCTKLHVVALAMGVESTVKELLPFLTSLAHTAWMDNRSSARLPDEVLVELAEALGHLGECGGALMVGGPSSAHLLFQPLICLCQIEETTVRDQAVMSVKRVIKQCSPDQVAQHLAAAVLKMLEGDEQKYFVSPVSGCQLAAVTYAHTIKSKVASITAAPLAPREHEEAKTLSAKQLADEIVENFRKACNETEPMVRRTAAKCLTEAVEAFGASITKEVLVPVWNKMVADTEQESIRVSALASAPAIFSVTTLQREADVPSVLYQQCAGDKSWRVRVAVAQSIGGVAKAIKSQELSDWETEKEAAKRIFLELTVDKEQEVRLATAAQSAWVGSILGADFARDKIAPLLEGLVNDDSGPRNDLVKVLLELAHPLGEQGCVDIFLVGEKSLLDRLLEDQNTNLRLAVILGLPGLISVLGVNDAKPVIKRIADLIGDKNWRVRCAAMNLLPEIAKLLPFSELLSTCITPAFKERSMDNCALIRVEWVKVCKEIAMAGSADQRTEFLNSLIKDSLSFEFAKESYQIRMVLLDAASEWQKMLPPNVLEEKLLPKVLEAADDSKVPNLRLHAAACMGHLIKGDSLAKTTVTGKLQPKLEEMVKDTDSDVNGNAKIALDYIK